jgi:hypothetical protein
MLFCYFLVPSELDSSSKRTLHSTALRREHLVYYGVILVSWIRIRNPDFESVSGTDTNESGSGSNTVNSPLLSFY